MTSQCGIRLCPAIFDSDDGRLSDLGPAGLNIGLDLNVEYSLIGSNWQTTLPAAPIGLPDANGNIIGESGAEIDPMLGHLTDNGGPTQTHAPQPGSPVIDAGDPTAMAGMGDIPEFDQRGTPYGRVQDRNGDMMARIDMGALEVQTVPTCDLDGDGDCNIDDIDALILEIVAATHDSVFDMTGDGLVDLADRDLWLADAGAVNLPSGNPYLLGDSNLDGIVDAEDFIIWNQQKFSSTGKWSQADWNADGVTDAQDFIIWNGNKFQGSDAASSRSSGIGTC